MNSNVFSTPSQISLTIFLNYSSIVYNHKTECLTVIPLTAKKGIRNLLVRASRVALPCNSSWGIDWKECPLLLIHHLAFLDLGRTTGQKRGTTWRWPIRQSIANKDTVILNPRCLYFNKGIVGSWDSFAFKNTFEFICFYRSVTREKNAENPDVSHV